MWPVSRGTLTLAFVVLTPWSKLVPLCHRSTVVNTGARALPTLFRRNVEVATSTGPCSPVGVVHPDILTASLGPARLEEEAMDLTSRLFGYSFTPGSCLLVSG